MSTLNFFLNSEERLGLVKLCLQNKCMLIPHLNYEDSSYYVIKILEEYLSHCNRVPLISIIHESFRKYPLEMDFFEKNLHKVFYIKQRHGGPYIDLFSPVVAELEDDKIGPGFLSIYPFFYNGADKFYPNDHFQEMFKLLLKYIKSIAKVVKIGNKSYWVGIDSLEKFRRGEISFVNMDEIDWAVFLS